MTGRQWNSKQDIQSTANCRLRTRTSADRRELRAIGTKVACLKWLQGGTSLLQRPHDYRKIPGEPR